MMQIIDIVRNLKFPAALKQEAYKYLYLITKVTSHMKSFALKITNDYSKCNYSYILLSIRWEGSKLWFVNYRMK